MPRSRGIALATALAVTALARPARAEDAVIAVLDVRGEGITPTVLDRFADAIEEGLSGADGYVNAPRQRMTEMLADSAWSTACTAGPCLLEVRSQTGAAYVVTGGLTGTGQSYRFTITLLETDNGDVVRQVSETCPACNVEDVAAAVTLATIALITDSPDVETPVRPEPADPERVAALERRVRGHARTLRRGGLLVIGMAVIAAGATYYFLEKDDEDVGYPLAGAAAGLAASGTLMLGLSLRF